MVLPFVGGARLGAEEVLGVDLAAAGEALVPVDAERLVVEDGDKLAAGGVVACLPGSSVLVGSPVSGWAGDEGTVAVAVAVAAAVVASPVVVGVAPAAAVSAVVAVVAEDEPTVVEESGQSLAGFRICPEGGRAVALGMGAVLHVAGEEVGHVLHGEIGALDDNAVGGDAVDEARKRGGLGDEV